MDKLFERNFIFQDRQEILTEIFDAQEALNSIIFSELGKAVIMLGLNAILTVCNTPFLMTEALSQGFLNNLESNRTDNSLISIKEKEIPQ